MANLSGPAAEAREARLLRHAPFIAVELDARRRITVWNEAAVRVFAVPAAEATGAAIEQILPSEGDLWADLAEGGSRTATHTRKDGVEVTCEWTCQAERDAEGQIVATACYGRDITDRAAREATLRLEGAMLRAIIENMNIIVWTMQHDGLCTYHQGKGLASIGMPPHALVGKNIRELYKNLGPEPLDAALAGTLQHTSTEVHGASFENWMIPVRGEDGSIELIVALSLNVTEQREGERALREKLLQIEQQQQVIRELSSPIIEVWDRVLTVPIIGTLDSGRAAELMDNLLQAVAKTRARFAILDLTGVEEVDTGTASHLLGLVRAVRLLGAESVITGIHPNIAQTIVALGLETTAMTVRATLREALGHCIRAMADARK
ncbi:rsbT co-antagonist protein RsbR [Nannocystis exedens]|uniref:RsbT co-antagonist protein RsbR n=1 Tax=Nannocystis exedens TaxID=54 RepID=A0A1I1YST5_9BACT|nr:STAS domain-containing protein [Nannocystis exedens]PCC70162.1 anti-anti-sigma factor [Nannocystis exedens]SFE22606.1 rsbT co-antagonist protein RsbR [Nannocystis exedens]